MPSTVTPGLKSASARPPRSALTSGTYACAPKPAPAGATMSWVALTERSGQGETNTIVSPAATCARRRSASV